MGEAAEDADRETEAIAGGCVCDKEADAPSRCRDGDCGSATTGSMTVAAVFAEAAWQAAAATEPSFGREPEAAEEPKGSPGW